MLQTERQGKYLVCKMCRPAAGVSAQKCIFGTGCSSSAARALLVTASAKDALAQSRPDILKPDALHSNSAADALIIGGNASLGVDVCLQ